MSSVNGIPLNALGETVYHKTNASSKENIKATSGVIKKVFGENKTQKPRYIQIFNKLASSVSLGTTTPSFVIPIAPAGFFDYSLNISIANAISYAVTDTETGGALATLSTLNISHT